MHTPSSTASSASARGSSSHRANTGADGVRPRPAACAAHSRGRTTAAAAAVSDEGHGMTVPAAGDTGKLATPPLETQGEASSRWGGDRPSPGIRYPPGARIPAEPLIESGSGGGPQPSVLLSAWRRSDPTAVPSPPAAAAEVSRPQAHSGRPGADGRRRRGQRAKAASFLTAFSDWLTRQQRLVGLSPSYRGSVDGTAEGRQTTGSRKRKDGSSSTASLDAMEGVVERYRELTLRWQHWRATGQHHTAPPPPAPLSWRMEEEKAPQSTDWGQMFDRRRRPPAVMDATSNTARDRTDRCHGTRPPAMEQPSPTHFHGAAEAGSRGDGGGDEGGTMAWLRRALQAIGQRLDTTVSLTPLAGPRTHGQGSLTRTSHQRDQEARHRVSLSFRDSYLDPLDTTTGGDPTASAAAARRDSLWVDSVGGGQPPTRAQRGGDGDEPFVFEEAFDHEDDTASNSSMSTEGEESSHASATAGDAPLTTYTPPRQGLWTRFWNRVNGRQGDAVAVVIVSTMTAHARRARKAKKKAAAAWPRRGAAAPVVMEEEEGSHSAVLARARAVRPTAWERPLNYEAEVVGLSTAAAPSLMAPQRLSVADSQYTLFAGRGVSSSNAAPAQTAETGSEDSSRDWGGGSGQEGSLRGGSSDTAASRTSAAAPTSPAALMSRLATDLSRLSECCARHDAEAAARVREARAHRGRHHAATAASAPPLTAGPDGAVTVASSPEDRIEALLCRYAYDEADGNWEEEKSGEVESSSCDEDPPRRALHNSVVSSHLFEHQPTASARASNQKSVSTAAISSTGEDSVSGAAARDVCEDPETGDALVLKRPHRRVTPVSGTALCDKARRQAQHREGSLRRRRGREPGTAAVLGERSFQHELLLECLYEAYIHGGSIEKSPRHMAEEHAPPSFREQRSLVTSTTHTPKDRLVRAVFDDVTAAAMQGIVEKAVRSRLSEIAGAADRAASEATLRSIVASLPPFMQPHSISRVVCCGVQRHIQSGRAASVALLTLDAEDEAVLANIYGKSASQEVALTFTGVPKHFVRGKPVGEASSGAAAVVPAVSYSPMTYAQLATLRPRTWLNDQVINNYMQLLCESVNVGAGAEVVASLGTHFYAKVESEMAALVARSAGEAHATASKGATASPMLPPLPAGHALLRWLRRRTHLLLPYVAAPLPHEHASEGTIGGHRAAAATTTCVRTVLVPVNLFGQHWALAVWHKTTDTWGFHDSLHRSASVRHTRGEKVLRELDHVLRECRRHLCPDAPAGRLTASHSRRLIIALPLNRSDASATATTSPDSAASPLDTLGTIRSLEALTRAEGEWKRRLPFFPQRVQGTFTACPPHRRPRCEGADTRLEHRDAAEEADDSDDMSRAFVEDLSEEDIYWFTPGTRTIPQQRNGDDCGVFVCQTAWCLAQGVAVSYAAAEAAMLRRVMTLELWHRRLLRRLPTAFMPSSLDVSCQTITRASTGEG